MARAWSDALGWLPRAMATNLFSAACAAAAGGILAALLTRATRSQLVPFAAALCAGTTSTVWLNATETEVYSAALCLMALMLLVAQQAGRNGEARWLTLTAYLFGLAPTLHMAALVAGPAAVVLATGGHNGRARWADTGILAAALSLAVAVGLGSAWGSAVAAVLGVAVAVWLPRGRLPALFGTYAAVLLGLSVLAFLPLRATHDPWLNSGNPVTWSALWDVVHRQQYGPHALWPREAPLLLQLGNLVEYLDWQFALGLAPSVAPSWTRTPVTLLYAGLAVYGANVHRRQDPGSWRALATLFASASVGLVLYLNFKAGPSFGYGWLPEGAEREVRERDYFFAAAFWVWGAWAGIGAVAAARRLPRALAPCGLFLAALPIAMSWTAADRSQEPDASLAADVGRALLWSAPPSAVLVTVGDNDSFPLWYLQTVEQLRPDVTVVASGLLAATWYRAELARRSGLLPADRARHPWLGLRRELQMLASQARRAGRPLAVAVTAAPSHREWLGGKWTMRGLVYVRADGPKARRDGVHWGVVDTTTAAEFVRLFGSWSEPRPSGGTDPTPRIMARLMSCPARLLGAARLRELPGSLDSSCKLR